MPPRRPPRPEADPVSQARRQAADLHAEKIKSRSLLVALLWFAGFQLFGTVIAASGFHARTADAGWALVYLGMFVGNAGSFLSVWYFYLAREERGDW
jgi:hypothetical protein